MIFSSITFLFYFLPTHVLRVKKGLLQQFATDPFIIDLPIYTVVRISTSILAQRSMSSRGIYSKRPW